jgi:circadian clock protein KaiC
MPANASRSEAHTLHPTAGPIKKYATGIKGFDDITGGGLPGNRVSAIIGGPGAGKTVFALQTIVNRLRDSGEPAIFVAFEEPVDRIRQNVAAFQWSFDDLYDERLRFIDAMMPVDAVLGGVFDLSGLLAGLHTHVADMGARSIVFDGIDMLLSSLQDRHLERQELLRLHDWVRETAISAVITVKAFGTAGRDQFRYDFLEYMTDCVVKLDMARTDTTSSRSMRIVKYRGSGFAANPVPLVIGASGMDVVAFRGARLDYPTFADRVSSGVPRLDGLLDGGYLRGSSILISGAPGTSKTSLAASFVFAACSRNEKALLVSFDESAAQIAANMRSIGLNLAPYIDAGTLVIHSLRSGGRSPEEHFVAIRDLLNDYGPKCLAIDPLSALMKANYRFTEMICETLIDEARSRGITVLCTSLLESASGESEITVSNISTVADTWLHVSYCAHHGERNRAMTIVKSRGTGHSNQVRELTISDAGLDLVDVYVAEGEVLMGSSRIQKEAAEEENRYRDLMAYQLSRMHLDLGTARLKAQLEAIRQELAWKDQESAYLDRSEADRIQHQQAAAERRLAARQGAPRSFNRTAAFHAPKEERHDRPLDQ